MEFHVVDGTHTNKCLLPTFKVLIREQKNSSALFIQYVMYSIR